MKLSVSVPNDWIPERKYILDFVFSSFLGIQYDFMNSEELPYYRICFEDKTILITDSFFSAIKESSTYLSDNFLPHVQLSEFPFSVEKDLVILYGENTSESSKDTIKCGVDIFASIFFMLTRWEEYVVNERDGHNRFPASASIAFKHHFLHRPIVNEYIEMLWKMMVTLGYDGNRKKRQFQIVPTHDIDHFRMSNRIRHLTKAIVKNLLHRKSFSFQAYLKAYFKDPYDTLDFLLKTSEKAGLKSHFYLMSVHARTEILSPSDWLQYKDFSETFKHYAERGHVVGFHPGYFTYNDGAQFHKEKVMLEQTLGMHINEGRHHYLMMKIPDTLQMWDEEGMNIDSTLSYADAEGFRCGTGDEFYYFDFLQRRQLNIKERPLIIMDGTLLTYRKYDLKKAEQVITYYKEIGKKYQMPITILFHNSVFFDRKGLKDLYQRVMADYIHKIEMLK